MKTGLVMEGGAMRGLFTAGVMDVMMEHGIEVDGAIGVSAGAVFGCNYKSKQIGRVIRYNKRFCRDKRYCSIRSLLRTGDLYGADFCYHVLPEQLDLFDTETFDQSPMEFHVVCTDMDTGKPVYHQCRDGSREEVEWMRASASMPLVSRPVQLEGRKLLDGGMSDSVPIRYFQSIGYERNIIILTQPADYVKKPQKSMPILRVVFRKNPEMLKTIANRYNVYNETLQYIREMEEQGKVCVIRPLQSLKIGSIERDPKEMDRVYQEGRKAALMKIEEIRQFVQ